MTFSLSRCPPKQRRKKKSKDEPTSKSLITQGATLSTIMMEEDTINSKALLRKRKRRRRVLDIPIPTFSNKRTGIDLSVLDTPPEKETKSKLFEGLSCSSSSSSKRAKATGAKNGGGMEAVSKCSPKVGAAAAAIKAPPPSSFVDSDDSDIENIPSSPVFRKTNLGSKFEANAEASLSSDEESPNFDEVADGEDGPKHANEKREDAAELPQDTVKDSPEKETAMPVVPQERETATATATSSSVATKPTTPDRDQLFVSLDLLYLHADVQSVTVKDIIQALEIEFETTMNKKTRKIIKTRLTDIIAGRVVPMAASPAPTPSPETRGKNADDQEPITGSVWEKTETAAQPAQVSNQDHTEHAQESVCKVPAPVVARACEGAEKIIPPPAAATTANPSVTAKPLAPAKSVATANPPVQAKSPVPKKSPKPRVKRQTRARKIQSDTASKQPAKRAPRKRTRKGTCSLCTTCQCSNTTAVDSPSGLDVFGERTLARTNVEIEKVLIKRQKKLEKTVDKYESDLDLVSRELKKHRRAIIKRKEAELQQGRGRAFGDTRFLPDVDTWDAQLGQVSDSIVASPIVEKAQKKMFGKVQKGGQVTLTQMMNPDQEEETIEDGLETIMEEPEQSQEEVENDEDEISVQSEVHHEDDPPDAFARVKWRDGKRETTGPSPENPIWSEMSTGASGGTALNGDSGWDRMFSDRMQSNSGDEGFDELLGLFSSDGPPALSMNSQLASSASGDAPRGAARITASQLSQGAQELAGSIEAQVTANPAQLSTIEGACPNWQENIRFALLQRGEEDIKSALGNIQQSKQRLDRMKAEFLAAWQRQQTVIQLYETSLEASLKRVTGEETASTDSPHDTSTDIESDAETVTEFSPLSQEEDASETKPDGVESLIFLELTANED